MTLMSWPDPKRFVSIRRQSDRERRKLAIVSLLAVRKPLAVHIQFDARPGSTPLIRTRNEPERRKVALAVDAEGGVGGVGPPPYRRG